MLRNIKVFFTTRHSLFNCICTEEQIVRYCAKGIRTGFTSPSDCVWLVP